ncbi:HAD family hydrolase [Streptomyces cinereoruber]|uniref:hypothetical protein n=1 Tax=Streptomyces cinereoruber TaxID=67260 RepID=UPI00363B485B
MTPEVIVFDVNETLSDMSGLENRLTDTGIPADSVQGRFTAVLRDGFALTAAGGTADFDSIAGGCGPDRRSRQNFPQNAEPLRKVAELTSGLRVVLLGEETDVVAQRPQRGEDGLRLVDAAGPGEALGQPAGADQEMPLVATQAVDADVLALGPVRRARRDPGSVARTLLACDHAWLLCSLHAGGRQQGARHHRRSAWGARGIGLLAETPQILPSTVDPCSRPLRFGGVVRGLQG